MNGYALMAVLASCFTLWFIVYTVMDQIDDEQRRYWDWVDRNEPEDTDDL